MKITETHFLINSSLFSETSTFSADLVLLIFHSHKLKKFRDVLHPKFHHCILSFIENFQKIMATSWNLQKCSRVTFKFQTCPSIKLIMDQLTRLLRFHAHHPLRSHQNHSDSQEGPNREKFRIKSVKLSDTT